jgi:uncharacterized protein involved in outer membrane biogenesis
MARRSATVALIALAVLAGAVGLAEALGWPFLAGPAARWLSARLERQVLLIGGTSEHPQQPRVHLFGGLRVRAPLFEVAAPAWSTQPFTMRAQDVDLRLRYRDLWALRQGAALRVRQLSAQQLQAHLERRADGSASWQFGPPAAAPAASASAGQALQFEQLELKNGVIDIDDAPLQTQAQVRFHLREGSALEGAAAGLQAQAEGQHRGQPLQARLQTGALLPWIADSATASPVDVKLQVQAGRSRLAFDGRIRQLLAADGLSGHFEIAAPSLAAVGASLGITLPTTAPFQAQGTLQRTGALWHAEVQQFSAGRSRLRGSFDYDARRAVPLLTGELNGAQLWLADLAPAVGAPGGGEAVPAPAAGKVLPVRSFDLPSLKAMDARIAVALDRVELGQLFAQPLVPLHGRLLLQDGVLKLDELLARTAEGQVRGRIELDGRQPPAVLNAALDWRDVRLERWLNQKRSDGTAYVTGRIGGRLELQGRGQSTAQLLASAGGRAQLQWTRGSISHQLVEAAGIDGAQLLGLWLKGDDTLAVHCGLADLHIERGVVQPRTLVVDTRDSTLWAEGRVSLADEQLDLRLQVAPKDFSPLTLRTPVLVQGPLAAPRVTLARGPLARRLVPAALLALANPLAAVLPLLDWGDDDGARQQAAACAAPGS